MNQTNIPKQWHEGSLGDLNNYQSKSVQPKNFLDETFELWSVPNFPTDKPEILSGQEIGSSKQAVAPKDVLICKINPRINRVWEVREISEYRKIASSEWIVFRQPMVEPRFFRRFFQSSQFRDKLCADVSGVGGSLTRAQPKKVANFSVPVPPLAEQKVIADKLDTLLAQVDSTKARLERIPQILKRFRQSVLAAAVNGRLTEEWRGTSDLTGWAKINLGGLVDKIESGKNLKCIETPPDDGEFGIIKISAVTWGIYDEKQSKTLPHNSLFLETRRIKVGDFLISRANTIELLGNPVIVHKVTKNLMLSDKVLRLEMKDGDKLWANIFLRSITGRQEIQGRSTGNQMSMRNIGQKALLEIPLPKPPCEEQAEIVRRVDQLFVHADCIEQQVNQALVRVKNLTQSILAKAFRGELTEQWRKDNPDLITGENSAEALLERIKAERAVKAPAQRSKRTA